MSGSKKVFTTLGSSNHVPEEREAFDYYATDPRAVEMLLELEQFSPVIWEPACGEGHISKVLQAYPPRKVYISRSRLACYKNGDMTGKPESAIAYAWYVWEKGFTGDPVIKWFN